MSRSFRSGAWIASALCVTLSAQSSPEQRQVPAELRSAARSGVDALAIGLAKAQLPAGIVAAATLETPGLFVTQSVAGRVTLRNVLDAFEETHPGYGAAVSSGVVKIRPNYGTSCDRRLRAPVPAVTLSGVDETVVEELFSLARPGVVKAGRSGGRVGSTPSRPDETPPARQARDVSLHLGQTSLEGALDALVLNARESVWVAEEKLPKQGLSQCHLRLVRGDGTSSVFFFDLAAK